VEHKTIPFLPAGIKGYGIGAVLTFIIIEAGGDFLVGLLPGDRPEFSCAAFAGTL
jgi:hypothetical protein